MVLVGTKLDLRDDKIVIDKLRVRPGRFVALSHRHSIYSSGEEARAHLGHARRVHAQGDRRRQVSRMFGVDTEGSEDSIRRSDTRPSLSQAQAEEERLRTVLAGRACSRFLCYL